jgi:hypothetical protein
VVTNRHWLVGQDGEPADAARIEIGLADGPAVAGRVFLPDTPHTDVAAAGTGQQRRSAAQRPW